MQSRHRSTVARRSRADVFILAAMAATALTGLTLVSGCAEKPNTQIAHGQSENAYEKAAFLEESYTLETMNPTVAQFVTSLNDNRIDEFKFDIGFNRLNLLVKSGDGTEAFIPLYHWVIDGHYDYDRSRNQGGEQSRFLILSTTVNADYRKRALIKANPDTSYAKEPETDPYRFKVADIDGRSFRLGKEDIPGLSTGILQALRQEHGLEDGSSVKVVLDLVNYHLFLGDKEILRMPVDYFDLIVKRSPANDQWKDQPEQDRQRNWQQREYVRILMDAPNYAPEDINIFAKSSFRGRGSNAGNGIFIQTAGEALSGIDPRQVSFAIEQGRLQIFSKNLSDRPIGHWIIKEHYDYDQRKKKRGDHLSKGELTTKLHDAWQARALIQADPVDFRTKELDRNPNLRTRQGLSGSKFVIGKDKDIPGLNSLVLQTLLTGQGLPTDVIVKDGDTVTVYLTRTHLIIKSETGVELVRMPVKYYDIALKEDASTGFWKDREELDQERTWEERLYVQVDPDGAEYTKTIDPVAQPDILRKKDVLDTEQLYYYLPSAIESPKNVDVAIPHFQGNAKMVKFRFTEKMLQVYEIPMHEGEYLDNPTNLPPVLSIPIRHVDYICSRDEHGNCVDRMVEDNDKLWQDREWFEPDFANMQIREVNNLPVIYDSYLVPSCFGEREARLLDFKFEGGALNIKVERSFRGNVNCMDIDSMSDLAFNVSYHYSFVKAGALDSEDYQAVDYPRTDENSFGFFDTQYRVLDHVHSDLQANEKKVMNRWNPKRKAITYYLNDQFARPENKVFLDATLAALQTINADLAKAKAGFRIEVANTDLAFFPDSGDLRYNMITLVDDPSKSGILGYGPAVSNPLTGEIVNARTIMYGGFIKQLIQHAYREVYRESVAAKSDAGLGSAVDRFIRGGASRTGAQVYGNPLSRFEELGGEAFAEFYPDSVMGVAPVVVRDVTVETAGGEEEAAGVADGGMEPADGASLFDNGLSLEELEQLAEPELLLEKKPLQVAMLERIDRIAFMSEHNATSAEMIDFHDDVKERIIEIVGGEENMRPWLELSLAEQKGIVDKILPVMWTGTFIHEMLHNLGLRHNFKGSEDTANYFTPEETDSGFTVAFSSVMDYGAKDLDELNRLGKYDIAALRFGYAREVEDNQGNFVKIPTTLTALRAQTGLVPKPYQYCSDEGVALNALCKRHDLGSGYAGVATGIYTLYKDRYDRANTRNGRSHFSLLDDVSHAATVNHTFRSLRLFYETKENIFNRFNIPFTQTFDPTSWLTDLGSSVNATFASLLEVLTTPDKVCIMARANASGTILTDPATQSATVLGVLELRDFDQSVDDCASSTRLNNVRSAAQGGRSFDSYRLPSNPNIYQDQIDVRGYWMDKLLAARWLLRRQFEYTFDQDYTGNFLDLGGSYETQLNKVLYDLLLDMYAADVQFVTNDGAKFTQRAILSQASSHRIAKHLTASVRSYLQLPDETTTFARELLRIIKKELAYADSTAKVTKWLNKFTVHAAIPNGREDEPHVKIEVNQAHYYVFEENEFALLLLNAINSTQFVEDYVALYGATKMNQVYRQGGQAIEQMLAAGDTEGVKALLAGLNEDDARLLRLDPQIVNAINSPVKLKYFNDLLTRLVEE